MAQIELQARAKINLTLDVNERLKNGYHGVEMIMQQIDLSDEVRITAHQKRGPVRVDSNTDIVPRGEENIAYRAAQLIRDMYGIDRQVTIEIKKNIPLAAGLGGGSADAAVVVTGLNSVWDLNLGLAEMMELGSGLGADVPFCIMGGTALARGIGDILTPIHCALPLDLLLVKPDFSVSTAWAYQNLDIEAVNKRPDNPGMVEALRQGYKKGIADRMVNVLEGVTALRHPEIIGIKGLMMDNGALGAVMSGSGPTVVGLYEDKNKAQAAADFFKTRYKEVITTKTVTLKEGE